MPYLQNLFGKLTGKFINITEKELIELNNKIQAEFEKIALVPKKIRDAIKNKTYEFIKKLKEKNEKIQIIEDIVHVFNNSTLVNEIKAHFENIKQLKSVVDNLFKNQTSILNLKLISLLQKIKNDSVLNQYKNATQLKEIFINVITKILNLQNNIKNDTSIIFQLLNKTKAEIITELRGIKELLTKDNILKEIYNKSEEIEEIIKTSGIMQSVNITKIQFYLHAFKNATVDFDKILNQTLNEMKEDINDLNMTSLIHYLTHTSLKEKFDQFKAHLVEYKEKLKNYSSIEPIITIIEEKVNELKVKIDEKKEKLQNNTIFQKIIEYVNETKNIFESFKKDFNITKYINVDIIIENLKNMNISIIDIPNNITEIKQKIIRFIDYNLTQALNKTNIYLIQNLLYMGNNIEEILDVIQANGTFLDVIKKINETVKETIEKIKEQINTNEKLKSLIEKIKGFKKNITEKIKALILTEDEIKAKVDEIKNYLNNSDDKVIQKIRTIISKIKAFKEEKRKELEEFLVKIKDMTPEEIIEEIKNRTKINQIEEKIKKQLLKLKDLDTKIFDKIMNITQNVNNYLSKNSTLKDIIEQLSELNKEIKKAMNGTDLENSINSFNQLLDNITLSSLKNISNIFQLNSAFNNIIGSMINLNQTELIIKLIETNYFGELIEKLRTKYINITENELIELNNKIQDEFELIALIPKKIRDAIKNKTYEFIKKLKEKNEKIQVIEDIVHVFNNSTLVNEVKAHFENLKQIKNGLHTLFKNQTSIINSKIISFIQKIKNNPDLIKLNNATQLKEIFINVITKILNLQDNIKNDTSIIFQLLNKTKEEIKTELRGIKELLTKDNILKEIYNKSEEIEEIIKTSGIMQSLNMTKIHFYIHTFINATIEFNKILNQTLIGLKDKIKDFNLTSLIINLRNLSISDYHKILKEKFEEFKAHLNTFKEKLKNNSSIEPIITKIEEKVNEFKLKLDEVKASLNNSAIYQITKDYINEKKYVLKLIKEDIQNNEIFSLKRTIEFLKKNNYSLEIIDANIQAFIKEVRTCDYDFLNNSNLIEIVNKTYVRIKTILNNSKTKEYFENKINNISEEIQADLERLKQIFEKASENDKFNISIKIKEFIEKILDIQKKIKESEIYKKYEILHNARIKILKAFKERINKINLLNLIKVINELAQKQRDFDFKGHLKKFNETKNDFIEQWNKYIQLDNTVEKISAIFNLRKDLFKKSFNRSNELIKDLMKNLIFGVNNTLLNEIMEKIDELNSYNIINLDKDSISNLINKLINRSIAIYEKISAFNTSEEGKKYDEALADVKQFFKNINQSSFFQRVDKSIKKHIENLNLTLYILKGIFDQYEDGLNVNVSQNIIELMKEELNIFKNSSKQLIKDSNLKINISILSEIENDLNKDLKNFEKKIKKFIEEYKDKNLTEIIVAKIKELNEMYSNKTSKEIIKMIKEKINANNKDILEYINNKTIIFIFDNIKNPKIKAIVQIIINNTKSINEKIKNNIPLSNITESLLLNLEAFLNLTIIKEIKANNTIYNNIVKKIDKIKEILEDIKKLFKTSEIANLIEKLKNTKRVLEMKEENKKIKKVVKLKRLESEEEITCKIDRTFSSGTVLTLSTKNAPNLLNNQNIGISISGPLNLTFNNDTDKCSSDGIDNLKNNLVFKSFNNYTIDKSKNRFSFSLYIQKKTNFVYPSFFYIIIKVIIRTRIQLSNIHRVNLIHKVRLESDSEYNETEVESFCLLEDDSDDENNKFNCFGYPENPEILNDTNPTINLESEYLSNINGTDNSDEASDETEETTEQATNQVSRNIFSRKTSEGGLSAGAIVGIILASLVAVAAVIGAIIFLNKKGNNNGVNISSNETANDLTTISTINRAYTNKGVNAHQVIPVS